MQTGDIPLHNLPAVQFLASDHSRAFGEHIPNHRISFFAIVWFTEDGGSHFIDFEPHPVKKDIVYLIGKNQVHSIPSLSLPQAKTIVFSSAFFDRLEEPRLRQLFSPFHNQGIAIPTAMSQPLTELFRLIMLESTTTTDADMLVKYTSIFLMHLYRFSGLSSKDATADDQRMAALLQLLEEHYKENRSPTFYAARIGLSPKRVNEILRQKAGSTINGFINQLLLTEAKRELFHKKSSVKEIAWHLGFADQSYFARFFKKHTGSTPQQFIAERQEAL